MNLLTDLGVLSAGHDLTRRVDEDRLVTPVHLGGGNSLFVWNGKADAVELVTWMPRFPTPPPFQRLGGTDLWAMTHPMPATAMFEYRIKVRHRDRETDYLDPFNPSQTTNPFGVNSVATGAAYQRPDWSVSKPGVAPGSISELRVQSQVWGERRHHLLYLPPGHDPDVPYRAVIVHDGPDFVHHSALQTVLDNLIATRAIPPIVGILHQPRKRLTEYNGDRRHASHIFSEVVPHIGRRLALSESSVVLGSSLGAVAALALAWRHSERVSGTALLSGAFATRLDDQHSKEVFGSVVDLLAEVGTDRRLAGHPNYMSCGRYEGLVDVNRSLAPRLRAAGLKTLYEETWDGHQWSSWRDRLGPALGHVLG